MYTSELERVFYTFLCSLWADLPCLPDNDDDVCSACLWKTKRKWKKIYIQKYRWRRLVWLVESFLVSSLSIHSNSLTHLLPIALDNISRWYSSMFHHLENFPLAMWLVEPFWLWPIRNKKNTTKFPHFPAVAHLHHVVLSSLQVNSTESDVSRKMMILNFRWKHDNIRQIFQHFFSSFWMFKILKILKGRHSPYVNFRGFFFTLAGWEDHEIVLDILQISNIFDSILRFLPPCPGG